MADIDPNFLNQALASGDQAAARQSAIADTNSVIFARNAQTVFNYGPQAYEARGADIKRVNAGTAYQVILNDIGALGLQQDRLAEASYGDLTRRNTQINREIEQNKLEGSLAFTESPAYYLAQQQLAGNALKVEVAKSEASIELAHTGQQKELADSKKSLAEATSQQLAAQRSQSIDQNRADFHAELAKAVNIDNTTNDPYYTQQINLLTTLADTNSAKLKDVWTEAKPIIDSLRATVGLPDELSTKLDAAAKVINYNAATQGMANTLSNLNTGMVTGKINQADASLGAALKSIGVDLTDPNSAKTLIATRDPSGGVTFSNPASNQVSRRFAPEEIEASPSALNLLVDHSTKSLNKDNLLTARQGITSALKSIAAAPIADLGIESFNGLTDSLSNENLSQETLKQMADAYGSFYTELGSGILFTKEGREDLRDDRPLESVIGAGLIPTIVEKLGGETTDSLKKKITDNPVYGQQLRTAIENRKLGGLTTEQFKQSILNIARPIIAANPGRYNPSSTNSAVVAKQNRQNLYAAIQRNLKIPQIADVPENVKRSLGLTDFKADFTPIGGRLKSIRNFLLGSSLDSNTYNEPINEVVVSVNAR